MNLRVPSPVRSRVPGRRHGLLSLVAAAFLLVTLTGCPTGYVQTSTGATVEASVVAAQDYVGDALSILQGVHNAAVDRHDALNGQEPADVHAKRRAVLKGSAAALRASWDSLLEWKRAPAGSTSVTVLRPLVEQAGPMLDAAAALGLISQKWADAAKQWIGIGASGLVPSALPRPGATPVGTVREPRETDYATLINDLVHRGSYFDGCNWHTPIGNGAWSSTTIHCGTVNANHLLVPVGAIE